MQKIRGFSTILQQHLRVAQMNELPKKIGGFHITLAPSRLLSQKVGIGILI